MRAWSAVVTSMITPPFSISARPVLTRSVPISIGGQSNQGASGRCAARDRLGGGAITSTRHGESLSTVSTVWPNGFAAVPPRADDDEVDVARRSFLREHLPRLAAADDAADNVDAVRLADASRRGAASSFALRLLLEHVRVERKQTAEPRSRRPR